MTLASNEQTRKKKQKKKKKISNKKQTWNSVKCSWQDELVSGN